MTGRGFSQKIVIKKKDVVVKEGSLRYGLVESLFLDTSFYFLLLLSF